MRNCAISRFSKTYSQMWVGPSFHCSTGLLIRCIFTLSSLSTILWLNSNHLRWIDNTLQHIVMPQWRRPCGRWERLGTAQMMVVHLPIRNLHGDSNTLKVSFCSSFQCGYFSGFRETTTKHGRARHHGENAVETQVKVANWIVDKRVPSPLPAKAKGPANPCMPG